MVTDLVANDKVGGLQNAMGHNYGCFVFAFAARKATELGAEVGVFRMTRGLSTLHQNSGQPFVTLFGSGPLAAPGTFIIAGAYSSPRTEMFVTGELAHVEADFCH